MIFVDSNVPMYLVGADHPNKARAEAAVHQLVTERERLVTNAEVFQEILHRYTAIRRREAIEDAWAALTGLVDAVFPIDLEIVDSARRITLESTPVSARDAIHTATMQRHGISRVLSFDTGFDRVDGIHRVS